MRSGFDSDSGQNAFRDYSKRVDEAFAEIDSRRASWKNEEEVRIVWVKALENALQITFDAERARKDLSYNNVVIEYKAPGLFKGSKESLKFKEATVGRLKKYITQESRLTGLPVEDFIGVAIDGDHLAFAQVRGEEIQAGHLLPFTRDSLELVMKAITEQTRRAVTAQNLLDDFGQGSPVAAEIMQTLADSLAHALGATNNSKVKMMYAEWKALYGQVSDMSVVQVEALSAELSFTWPGDISEAISGQLFVIHTYNSILVKLLAAEIVAAHQLTSVSQPAQVMSTMNDDELIAFIGTEIEHSKLFLDANLKGFVEEVIFSWYLDVAVTPEFGPRLNNALRGLLKSLSLYRTDRLDHTRDILRDVYEGLVPAKLRQSLGEFYTPDWLVDFTLNQSGVENWLDNRVMDPTCGSGAFLIAVIRRKRREARERGLDAVATLEQVCDSTWGIDLNPLAVQIARVNYLMEIVDLLQMSGGVEIEVPVLLADAIYSPAADPLRPSEIVTYSIGSEVAGLTVELPGELVLDRGRLDRVFDLMGRKVEQSATFGEVSAILVSSGALTDVELTSWREPLEDTYNRVLDLHERQWNGIWFRIIRNYFWSATAGQFSVIVGNPPWVRWSKLPPLYRERVKPTCEDYGIFSENGMYGGVELDVSAMITYAVADKWLETGGTIAVVITGALFKNSSSSGFRKFVLKPSDENSAHLSPVGVDDFKLVQPFKNASNHSVVAVFTKSLTATTYPVRYTKWSKVPGSRISPPDQLEAVLGQLIPSELEAMPVDPSKSGSPWNTLPRGRHGELAKFKGPAGWIEGRKGITTDLNGIYFIRVLREGSGLVQISSRPEAGKKDIGPRRDAWIEPDLLYPLIKGAGDFEPYYLKLVSPKHGREPLFALVPNRGILVGDYAESSDQMESVAMTRTRNWFGRYSALLRARSTYRRQMNGAPEFAIYNVGAYTFAPWKVIWPEMASSFYAAVAGSAEVPLLGVRPYVPDHKVYFASFDSKEPAYFVCGLLNHPTVREWIQGHSVSIQIGDVFKHLFIPEFDEENEVHVRLAQAVEKAHGMHDEVQRAVLVTDIEQLASLVLWG